MVLVEVVHDPVVRPLIARLIGALAQRVADGRAARRRRAALESLLFVPEHRLRDLGISRDELIQAIRRRG